MKKFIFRVHAVQRMFERKISTKKVLETVKNGEIIEDYSAEMPEPGHLILGFQGKHTFHVVVSENPATDDITIITVYIPNPKLWSKDFRIRRA